MRLLRGLPPRLLNTAAGAVFASLALAAQPLIAAERAPLEAMEISTRPITRFHIGHDENRFGPLEFVGGLEMTASVRDFGGLSSFRFTEPGQAFAGVADTGFWFYGTLVHDTDRRPSGIGDFRMEQMVDANGDPVTQKWEVDAEAFDIRDGVATVGFERRHRIAQFRFNPGHMSVPFRQLDFLVPVNELRMNRGFETVTHANADGPLKGAVVVVSEKSLDKQGNVFAAILDGPGKGVFKVKRNAPFDITDGAFLPDGDLLLLERAFSMAEGVRMRLRRIEGGSIGKGRVADGPILLEADMSYQIDNMEGLDVWRREDGATMVSLMSDDNHSILQRNLYLEFVLHED